jgi:hypothetical protein
VTDDASLVTPDGLLLPSDATGALDVRFDGRRIWSIDAGRLGIGPDGRRFVAWPNPIRPYLNGATHVVVVDHTSNEVKIDVEATFGTSTERIAVVDEAGQQVAVTKWGRLNRPFDTLDRAALDHYLDQVEEVLAVLRDECGVDAFIAWGSLLGALRGGRLIGHDVDVDVAYASRHQSPADLARESFRVEAALRRHGWLVRRENFGFLALFLEQEDGWLRNLDVFTAWITDGWLYMVHDIRARLPMSALVPLGEIELEGRMLPAPADPAALMSAAYGPGWRTPDPSFTYTRRRPVFRRMIGWMGALRAERDYWEEFYLKPEPPLPTEPSRFASWVSERDDSGLPLADIGHGNGRDAVWFAGSGRAVTGIDCTWGSLRRAGQHAAAHGVELDQWLYNLSERRHALVVGARLAHAGPHVVYARMFVDAVRPFVRHNLWRVACMGTRGGGRLYLEFRADPDAADDYVYGDHKRYPVRPDVVARELVAAGATIVEQAAGCGFAPLGGEDPYMCRMVVEWR